MKRIVLKFTLLILASMFLPSCGNYTEMKSGSSDQFNLANAVIDFSTVQSAIFSPKCVSCHQQYASYSAVKNEVSAIVAAVSAGRMPKSGGPLSDQLKHLLNAWISAGAPEVFGKTPTTPAPVPEPTWKSISDNIITPRCLVCHNWSAGTK